MWTKPYLGTFLVVSPIFWSHQPVPVTHKSQPTSRCPIFGGRTKACAPFLKPFGPGHHFLLTKSTQNWVSPRSIHQNLHNNQKMLGRRLRPTNKHSLALSFTPSFRSIKPRVKPMPLRFFINLRPSSSLPAICPPFPLFRCLNRPSGRRRPLRRGFGRPKQSPMLVPAVPKFGGGRGYKRSGRK